MIEEKTNYRNITTGNVVTINKIYYSGQFDQQVIDYYNILKDKSFIKPYYVFEKTYVETTSYDI